MKQSKAAPTVSEIENTGIQEAEKKPQDSKQVFKLDPNAPTSVINGNSVLFIGRGAREVTLVADSTNDEA